MRSNTYFYLGFIGIAIASYVAFDGLDGPPMDPSHYSQRKNHSKHSENSADQKNVEVPSQKSEPAATSSEERVPANAILSEGDFIKKYPGNWLFKRMGKGRLNYISGGNVPNLGRSPQSVRTFIEQIAPLLEVPAQEITEPQEINRTDLTRVYHANQSTDGYPVYQSMLSVHVRESDDSIFMINNQLKDVSDYNKDLRYTRQQAETYIQSHYAGEFEKVVFREGPVIFKSDSVAPELAWVFTLTYKQPKLQQVEIVIGAYSGEEIHRQNINIQ